MSPEQCKGSGGVDAKSDVYSLGVIFYELLAGQPPFLGSAHGELIVQHIVHEPPPLATLADQTTPEVLTRLIHLMMSKDKTARPTMRQVVAELDRLGGLLSGVYGTVPLGAGISAPGVISITPTPPPGWLPGPGSLPGAVSQPSLPSLTGGGAARSYHGMTPVPGAASSSPASTLAMSAGQVPVPQPRRFPLSIAIGGLAGAIAVGVVLILSFGRTTPPPPPPPHNPAVQLPQRPTPQQVDSPKTVHWSVTTMPQGAKVIRQRDGEVLGTTPLSLDAPRALGGEPVRLVLPGYAEMSLSLDLDKDSDLQIELHRKGGRERRTKDPGSSSKTHGKGYVPGDLTVVD